ncbi:hypothetical protein BDV23DRAFT_30182 [Aspergillus alliaceus]|uniref:Uncharacterized protein n=1 Tax=Petromyces alliaceus TaxID=209559 RepID=A0A5N7BSI7_PETAA|nr:hypothetical protein BDV23DRAFT_30182 [Aspergillus alliaceus]
MAMERLLPFIMLMPLVQLDNTCIPAKHNPSAIIRVRNYEGEQMLNAAMIGMIPCLSICPSNTNHIPLNSFSNLVWLGLFKYCASDCQIPPWRMNIILFCATPLGVCAPVTNSPLTRCSAPTVHWLRGFYLGLFSATLLVGSSWGSSTCGKFYSKLRDDTVPPRLSFPS